MEKLRALIIEDSENDCKLLARTLTQGGYDLQHKRVDSAEALIESLDTETWDVVISDYSMPGFNGTAALTIVREKGLDMPFLFVSGTIGEETAVNAMRVGAQDYIMKSNLKRLLPAIGREMKDLKLRREHEKLQRRTRQLEKFEAIGRLAGGVAHDFNNVIGAIMGWAELGMTEVPAESRAAKYFQQISNHSERAVGLTRQLLTYARRQILEPHSLQLNTVIGESESLLEKLMGGEVRMEIKLSPELKMVRADRSQIEQVVMNLCVNARDAMPQGGLLRVETSNVTFDEFDCERHMLGQAGPYVLLTVTDTGTGMDAATIERIFEPFFTTKEMGKGTGLGLATSMGVVSQHGGIIEVESQLGKGTTFLVYLPASEEEVEETKNTPGLGEPTGTETILLADDHEGLRQTTKEVLSRLGYTVLVARDGEEALREFMAHADKISLVLLDVAMPKLSGGDVYAKISAMRPGVPVIVTSGYSADLTAINPQLGANAFFLQKPYRPEELTRKIREMLDKAQN